MHDSGSQTNVDTKYLPQDAHRFIAPMFHMYAPMSGSGIQINGGVVNSVVGNGNVFRGNVTFGDHLGLDGVTGDSIVIRVNGEPVHKIVWGAKPAEAKEMADALPTTYVSDAEVRIKLDSPGSISQVRVATSDVNVAGDVRHSVTTTSGEVVVKGNVADHVTTTSGDITVEGAVRGSATTVSGNIKAREIHGDTHTVSGDIRR